MKKLLIVLAVVLMATSAFAQSGGRLFVQPNATFTTESPATTGNDDSCDIGTAPAATLLLPHFEVDFASQAEDAMNTIFTITNTSAYEQIAHIVVWTDWSYPVIDFNIWLTGYDVQGISLYDIISRGLIPVTGDDAANSTDGPFSVNEGDESAGGNPLHIWTNECTSLPGPIPDGLLQEVQDALTGDDYFDVGQVGGEHDNAVGYVTVDVAATCSTSLPIAPDGPDYFANEILFDNVLIGDYMRINPTLDTGNYAGGNPMVHIRAVPEGGESDDFTTNFAYTFYDRYLEPATVGLDRRQPLPGLFAARFITSDNAAGFGTQFAIWREGWNSPDDEEEAEDNSSIPVTEIVRFDEHENPYVVSQDICQISPCDDVDELGFQFPETSNYDVDDAMHFPPQPTETDDVGGWMYLNLNNPYEQDEGGYTDRATSQNWVVVQMTAESRYGVDFDAAWLGNGCSDNPGELVTFAGLTEECGGGDDVDDPCGIGPAENDTNEFPSEAWEDPS